jgi:hypothetical protein
LNDFCVYHGLGREVEVVETEPSYLGSMWKREREREKNPRQDPGTKHRNLGHPPSDGHHLAGELGTDGTFPSGKSPC